MCIVVVTLFIKAADSDAPAAVLIPAKGFHVTGLHGDDGYTDLAHHVVSQVGTLIAIAPGRSKIIIIAVVKTPCNRGKGFEAIACFKAACAVFGFCLHFVFADHAAKHGFISF